MFETINLWIQDHQDLVYILIFTYCVSKSSILPVFAGMLVAAESLMIVPAVTSMIAGGLVGDVLRFGLARKYGDAIVRKLPKSLSDWMGKTLRLFEHYGVAYILLCRYPHGVRSFGVFPVGMSSMSFICFLPLSIASVLLWVGLYYGLGHSLGAGMSELVEQNLAMLSPILLIVFLVLGWFALRRIDRLEQQAERAIK
ncbi:DedA family protein [Thalassospira sp. UBA1131]|uniref:DedA family protein n=1 Tax=Thalassospira sp. UBA1131 TaxID=1947672 RepID=UPI0025CB90B8|nr:DedA family protein [Thalassospira sp. UBA1131]